MGKIIFARTLERVLTPATITPTLVGELRMNQNSRRIAFRRCWSGVDESAISDDSFDAVLHFLRQRRASGLVADASAAEWELFHANLRGFTLAILSAGNIPEQDRAACAQDIWREVIGRLPDWKGAVSVAVFLGWLKKVAQTKVADWHREHLLQRRRWGVRVNDGEVRLFDRHRGPAEEAEIAEEMAILRHGLYLLRQGANRSTWRVIEARYLEGKSIQETCQATGRTAQQVYDYERRGLERLRAICEKLVRGSR